MNDREENELEYLILTATYNRGRFLIRIMTRLEQEAERKKLSCFHLIFNDASTEDRKHYDYIRERFFRHRKERKYYRGRLLQAAKNAGRAGFWKTLNFLFEKARHYQHARYLVSIPDDAIPCPNFLSRIAERFEEIKRGAPNTVALNILPSVLANWGTARFVDDCYIADFRLLEALNFKLYVPEGHWRDNPSTGSGTGFQMTTRIKQHAEYEIAPCEDISYLKPIECESMMFRHVPSRPVKWWRDNYIEDVNNACRELHN